MNDLLDLNWSSGPSSQPALQPDKPKTNAFDLLSKPSSPTYLSSAPLRATPSPSPAFGRPASQSPLSNSSPKTAASTSAPSRVATPAADAFSNLLSLPATAGPSKSLTIAERQAQLAREKQEAANREREQFAVDGAFWNRFGGDSGPSLAPAPVLAPAGKATNGLDDLLQPTPRSAQLRPTSTASGTGSQLSPQPPKNAGTFWDLQPDAEASPAPTATPDPWDFDALPASTPAASKPASGMRTPVSNFDFNERDNDDGDLLGDLGKPARPKPAQPAPSASPPQSVTRQAVRSSSPPPHVVGKIVEMGFTPAQARGALAKTDTGVNVEAAIELLLGGQSHTMADVEVEDHHVERERRRREDERRRHAARRAGPSRDSVQARPRNSPRQPAEHEPVDTFSETTDRLVAQATEIGSSAWSKATSLWNSSKERTIKAIEEQRKAMEQRDRPKDGRPRWMVGAEALEDGRRDGEAGSFTNDAPLEDRERPRQATRPIRRDTRDAPDARSSKEADLLSAEPPKTYVSPFRHGKKPPHSAPITRVTSPAPPLITRQLVSATPAQISASVSHQAKGNDHFKLGRFAEAESAYSSAISSLPERHLLLVPLHNNRAAARLKLGDSGPAAADCSTVLDLVGPLYHPSKEAPLPAEFADVKLADALAKALVKRAQAYEMGEKWKDALADWERVLGLDAAFGSSHKALAADGVRRAKRAIEGDAPAQSRPAPRPIKVAPSKPADVSKSAAVGELRKAAKAQEAEDDLRAAHKDAVDAKLLAWKAGKETNLRALIASLSTVLWDDIMAGGLKVGMHELITDKQVKMKYMKVVARLHPDKLNASNTTVEQRMLANGAFGTLSEAWAAFNA
ncbi:auxilin-like clathrin-binding protein required for normal clathrin function [Cryptotrichosporon argae]